ncbi:MAG: DUF3127 domain-containing protein [Kiritimatiellaeota bacterium]|nr:DUF3127 domain-containing protein [Kiritimatiellota bacterium]
MDYTFTGTVKKVGDVQSFASGFTKRELIVTSEEERFPQNVAFEFLKERADMLEGVNESDRVTVHFDISSREWTAPDGAVKYFTSLRAWKLDKADESGGAAAARPAAAPRPATSSAAPAAAMPKDAATAEGNDDLPF